MAITSQNILRNSFKEDIPYEIHLTTTAIAENSLDDFVSYCLKNGYKALLIELHCGEQRQQPMISTIIHTGNLDSAWIQTEEYTMGLHSAGFPVIRTKLEIPYSYATEFIERHSQNTPESNSFNCYYEWHARVQYQRHEELVEICLQHGAHLSRNGLKKNMDMRFVTLREYGNADIFDSRIHALYNALEYHGWLVEKQEAEYCVYDNHAILDKGWLRL